MRRSRLKPYFVKKFIEYFIEATLKDAYRFLRECSYEPKTYYGKAKYKYLRNSYRMVFHSETFKVWVESMGYDPDIIDIFRAKALQLTKDSE